MQYAKDKTVAVGYNACLDLVARAVDVLAVVPGSGDVVTALDHSEIASVKDLQARALGLWGGHCV